MPREYGVRFSGCSNPQECLLIGAAWDDSRPLPLVVGFPRRFATDAFPSRLTGFAE